MYESEEVMERKVLLDRIGAALFRVLIIIIITIIIIEMLSGRNDIVIIRKGSLARPDSNLRHQFA